MIRRKLSPSEIVDRLQVIEALTELTASLSTTRSGWSDCFRPITTDGGSNMPACSAPSAR